MSNNQFIYDLPKQKTTIGKVIIDFLQGIVVALAILVVCYLFLVIPNQVDGQSMMPNFHDKELLFTNKIIELIGDEDFMKPYNYDYQRADVVIFQKPGHDDFIKRVIGLPGDSVMISKGHFYINGQLMRESYIPEETQTQAYSFMSEGETVVVPPGHYFLSGDNRNNSKDSRFDDIGFVAREHIKGRVFIRYWPMDRFSLIKAGEYNLE